MASAFPGRRIETAAEHQLPAVIDPARILADQHLGAFLDRVARSTLPECQ
jgi:hypothetical protein